MYVTFKTLGFFFPFFIILKKDNCSSKEYEFATTYIYKSTHIPHFSYIWRLKECLFHNVIIIICTV